MMLNSCKLFCRRYQTKTGVYGHLPRTKRKYEISSEVLKSRARNSNFYRLVAAYRDHGHKSALINPIALSKPEQLPELQPIQYDLDLNQTVAYHGIIANPKNHNGTIQEAIQFLQKTYCQHIGAEFSYLSTEESEWFSEKLETMEEASNETKIKIMTELLKSQVLDHFLAAKFSTLKRYGGEGAESMMAFFWQLLKSCGSYGVTDIVIGMPHRGRLNLLTGMFQVPPPLVYRKIRGLLEFDEGAEATGDVLSHLTSSVDIGPVHVTMLPNPSHLEAVNPASMGKTRAKQMSIKEGDYGDGSTQLGTRVVNVQVHGDAAFIGQGINQEALSFSKVPHFNVGGSVHLIVNNQVGFTTPAERGRSSLYASDLAKMISVPVLHVNGDHPDLVAQVTDLAIQYQRKFHKDVFIDMNCYRQWGHNEVDDPTFTNPAIYKIIHNRKTVPDAFSESLAEKNIVTRQEIEEIKKNYYDKLNNDLKDATFKPGKSYFMKQWSGIEQASKNLTTWDTGMNVEILRYIGIKSVEYPNNFNIHKHLQKTHVNARLNKLSAGIDKIDWATAEAMAIGSLLYQGFNVRISGQDVGRGTFSHRHAMLVDQETSDIYIPLNHILEDQPGKLEVANSILSEEAVLAFEYGMSIENPNNLIIWEAQFGDFFNGAQIIIDTLVSSGETKWMKCSGLVMLLPHGYDGAGPEHSSARIERFLQLTDSKETAADGDNVNMQIVYPTTPAQYFHLLRRQMVRNYRKPLVIIGPKTLLRLAEATSHLNDFAPSTNFLNVIPDNTVELSKAKKIIFTSGKHYYNLEKERKSRNITDVGIVRIESLCPFPTHELQKLLEECKSAKEFIWSQEEPRNMGAWGFVKTRFENLVGVNLKYVGPYELGTPALVGKAHVELQEKIIKESF